MRLAVAALGVTLAAFGQARAADLHFLWDRQCGGCHGHAADFARASLEIRDGVLVGRTRGDQVRAYLVTHNGGYDAETIARMLVMLRAQAGTPALFRDACVECHGSAAQFARESLTVRDGRLEGKFSRRGVADTLARHGGLDAEQARLLLEVLTRVEAEISGRPQPSPP